MKATELIVHLNNLIDQEGPNVEVFMSASGYYCSESREELQPPERYDPRDRSTPVFWSIGHSHQSY